MPDRSALWSVAGVVAAPVGSVWEALVASIPALAGEDVRALVHSTSPQVVNAALGDPLSDASIRVQVDPDRHCVTVEGQWWYRGETSVEPDERGSLVRIGFIISRLERADGWCGSYIDRTRRVSGTRTSSWCGRSGGGSDAMRTKSTERNRWCDRQWRFRAACCATKKLLYRCVLCGSPLPLLAGRCVLAVVELAAFAQATPL
jgi:hypothetical protein